MDLGIIGPGRVGTALGIAASRAGYTHLLVAGRDEESSRQAAERIGGGARAVTAAEAAAADLVWLTVADDRIEAIMTSLLSDLRAGSVLVHCSGALASSVLAGARDRARCAIAAAHPIQTFPTITAAVADLPGSVWALEGDPAALEVLEPFLAELGSRTFRIDPAAKTRLHVAAVLVCNYLVALVDAALDLAEPAVGDRRQALDALLPMVEATIRNVAALGPSRALTGPLVRGDLGTLHRHQEELTEASPTLRAIYAALGSKALELARRRGTLDPEAIGQIEATLAAIAAVGGTEPPDRRYNR